MKYRDDRIRGRQAEMELTVGQLAKISGVSEPTVVSARKGRPISVTSLDKLGTALGLTLIELLEPKSEGPTLPA